MAYTCVSVSAGRQIGKLWAKRTWCQEARAWLVTLVADQSLTCESSRKLVVGANCGT